MPPRRSTAASVSGKAKPVKTIDAGSTTQDDRSRISISSDSLSEIIPSKIVTKRTTRAGSSNRNKDKDSDNGLMIIEDEETKAVVRGAPTKSSKKVRPPRPGTPEYEELKPVTIAKEYAQQSARDIGMSSKLPAKRVKVEAPTTKTVTYKSIPSVVIPVKKRQDILAANVATSKRKRLVESSEEEVPDSDSGDGDNESEDHEPVRVKRNLKDRLRDQEEEASDDASDEENSGSAGSDESGSVASDDETSDASNPFVDAKSSAKGKAADKGKEKAVKIDEKTVYLEDVQKPRFIKDKNELPANAVMKSELQDYVLAETYNNLPWVKHGILCPWGVSDSATAPSPISFSIWQSVLEPYNEAFLFRWMTFQQSGQYVNPSRVDPNKVTVSYLGSQRFLVWPGSNSHCICISLILIHDCSLVFGKDQGKTKTKKVGGVLHLQEMERLAACFCMQYDQVSSLDANAYGWVFYFDTRPEDYAERVSKFSPSKPRLTSGPAQGVSLFSKYPGIAPPPSPSKSSAGSPSKASSSKSFKPVLDFKDTVPIYDGREPKFDILQNLDKLSTLPLWMDGEVDAPRNSLAAVGYTAHTYKTKDSRVHLNFNVQWLVVLGEADGM